MPATNAQPAPTLAAAPAPIDPSTPPIELLAHVGPEAPQRTFTLDESLAYCRGLATSHYENFSVLTSLVPPRLRDDFAAVYAFCRWADDLGDETGSTPDARAQSERLLAWWRDGLHRAFESLGAAAASGNSGGGAHGNEPTHPVYVALRATAHRHPHLTAKPFDDLIDAFVQDQRITRYQTWEQVLGYCARSANPVGRIVLTLGGYAPPDVDPANAERYRQSDATCTALQLINFWQDARRDLLERDRVYIPETGPDGPTGITAELLRVWAERPDDPRARVPYIRGLRPLVDHAADLFDQGRPLPASLDQEGGTGLAPVVWLFGAGGDAILRAVRRIGCATLWERPRLGKAEKALLVGRAWLWARSARRR